MTRSDALALLARLKVEIEADPRAPVVLSAAETLAVITLLVDFPWEAVARLLPPDDARKAVT